MLAALGKIIVFSMVIILFPVGGMHQRTTTMCDRILVARGCGSC
jgi:hypothetical protein